MLTLSAYDCKWFFGPSSTNQIDVNTKVMDFATNLYDVRKRPYSEFISTNKFVSKLTGQQKDDINVFMKEYTPKNNEI